MRRNSSNGDSTAVVVREIVAVAGNSNKRSGSSDSCFGLGCYNDDPWQKALVTRTAFEQKSSRLQPVPMAELPFPSHAMLLP